MRELLNFFIRNSKWFVFAILLVVSAVLLVRTNPLHHGLYLTSANAVSSSVYEISSNITSYFNLRENNEGLNRRNAELQHEVMALRQQVVYLQEQILADSINLSNVFTPYDFIVAHVIKNSVVKPNNYITINKGELEGVRPEMGVIDQNGVVGVVNVVGDHSARVISLLNPIFRLSCKIKGKETFGSLVWDGKDPRYAILEELPRHAVFNVGDTIVTSGYSSVFPPGLPVGIIKENAGSPSDNFFSLRIKLLTDFSSLDNVQVVINELTPELRILEESDKKLEETKK